MAKLWRRRWCVTIVFLNHCCHSCIFKQFSMFLFLLLKVHLADFFDDRDVSDHHGRGDETNIFWFRICCYQRWRNFGKQLERTLFFPVIFWKWQNFGMLKLSMHLKKLQHSRFTILMMTWQSHFVTCHDVFITSGFPWHCTTVPM